MRNTVRWTLVGLLLITSAQAAPEDDPRITPVVVAHRKARPAVVNISAKRIARVRMGLRGADPFEDIFPLPFLRNVPVRSVGSGFIVNPQGYIVTNAHVVRRAQQITVTLHKNLQLPARVISADPSHDLAVLKVDLPSNDIKVQHLPLGRSDDLMVGETVIAIGNPFGYANTVTTGVISALDRTLTFRGGVKYEHLIQIDAPINPGNSGGPLLNIKGELIGINTAIRPEAQNIGFAIPVALLVSEFPSLLDFERINRVIFGATAAQRQGPSGPEVYVAAVRPDTPAAKLLRKDDVILSVDNLPTPQIPDFTCAMLTVKPEKKIALKLLRGGKKLTVKLSLQPRPKPDGRALAQRLFGMTLRAVTPELERNLRLPVDRGLLVVGLETGGPAESLGVRVKDVVFLLGRLYVKDLDDLGMVLEDVEPDQRMRIGIARGNVRALSRIRGRADKETGESPGGPPF